MQCGRKHPHSPTAKLELHQGVFLRICSKPWEDHLTLCLLGVQAGSPGRKFESSFGAVLFLVLESHSSLHIILLNKTNLFLSFLFIGRDRNQESWFPLRTDTKNQLQCMNFRSYRRFCKVAQWCAKSSIWSTEVTQAGFKSFPKLYQLYKHRHRWHPTLCATSKQR